MGFVYLGLAIVLELLGTTFLKYTLGFTKLSPSLVVVAAYTGAFYFLSRSLQFIDLNIAYATWAAVSLPQPSFQCWSFTKASTPSAPSVWLWSSAA